MSTDFLDSAAVGERIRRVSMMVPESGDIKPDTAEAIVTAAREHVAAFKLAPAYVAQSMGVARPIVEGLLSAPDIGAELSRLPKETRNQTLRALNAWVEEDFRAVEVKRPHDLIPTIVVKRTVAVARQTRAMGTCSLLTGPAGIGKTSALDAIPSELPGTIIIRIDQDCRSAGGLLRKIYEKATGRTRRTLDRVYLDSLTERLGGSGRLLILDQAHTLRDSGIHVLMDLHDVCGLPIMLVGTVDLDKRLRDESDPMFGQMSSRIGLRQDLLPEISTPSRGGRPTEWISLGELRKFVSGHKLKFHDDGLKMLWRIANFTTGFLRRVRQIARLAEAVALHSGHPEITGADVTAAVRSVGGGSAAQALGESTLEPRESDSAARRANAAASVG